MLLCRYGQIVDKLEEEIVASQVELSRGKTLLKAKNVALFYEVSRAA